MHLSIDHINSNSSQQDNALLLRTGCEQLLFGSPAVRKESG